MRYFYSFSSLRIRLILLVLLALVPALGIMLYTAAETRQREARQAQEEVLAWTQLAAGREEQLIEATRQVLISLAQFVEVRRGDPAACSARLAELLEEYQNYNAFAVADLDGNLFCSTTPLTEPVNVADRSWFQLALQTRNFAVGEYQLGRINNRPILVFGYPILDAADQVQAVVAASLDLGQFSRLSTEAKLPFGTTLTIIDRRGTILDYQPEPTAWVGQSIADTPLLQFMTRREGRGAELAGPDGVTRLYASVPLRSTVETGLYLAIGTPVEIAFEEANQILVSTFIWLGLAGLLALLAAWFGGNIFILRRVKTLVNATERLKRGDLSARTGLVRSGGELGQLARAFDNMAATLEQREIERKQAEEAIREQREWLQVTLSSIGDAVIATDLAGRVTFMNPVAQSLTGWSQADALDKPLEEVFHIVNETSRNIVENPVTKVIREGRVVGLANHTILLAADGREIPIDDSGAPIQDEAGHIRGVVLVFRDVTERKQAEKTFRFLAEASHILASSLDYETTLASVAQLAVPHLADWCTVHVIQEDETIQQLAVAHVDPPKVALAHELQQRYPPDWDAPTGLPKVLRTGRSELYPEITDAMLEAGARDAEHLRIARELRLRSALVAPLIARGRTLGAMTFVWAESGHHYGPADLALAEELAHRAALAVDNARLYREAQAAFAAVQQLNEQLEQRVAERTVQLETTNKKLEGEIDERKRIEEQLRQAKDFSESVINSSFDGILAFDRECRYTIWNPAMERLTGLTKAETVGKSAFEVFPFLEEIGEDHYFLEALAGRTAIVEDRPYWVAETGRQGFFAGHYAPIRDLSGQVIGGLGLIRDITERRQIEAELDEIQHRLVESREKERLRLARELHDGPMQDLHSIAFRLEGLKAGLDQVELTQATLVQTTMRQVTNTLRLICGELRPQTLAPFGLEKAILSETERFQEAQPQLQVHWDLMPDEQRLPEQVRLVLFRIFQEALQNLVQHAEASRVDIRFKLEPEQVMLEIEDDGRGFEIPQRWIEFARQGRLGLIEAAEQAEAIGGELQVSSTPSRGTTIRVVVPYPR